MRPHRRQPTRLPHPWDSLGKNTEVGCHFLLWEHANKYLWPFKEHLILEPFHQLYYSQVVNTTLLECQSQHEHHIFLSFGDFAISFPPPPPPPSEDDNGSSAVVMSLGRRGAAAVSQQSSLCILIR